MSVQEIITQQMKTMMMTTKYYRIVISLSWRWNCTGMLSQPELQIVITQWVAERPRDNAD